MTNLSCAIRVVSRLLLAASAVASTACNGAVASMASAASNRAAAAPALTCEGGSPAGTLIGANVEGAFCPGWVAAASISVPLSNYGDTYTKPYIAWIASQADIPVTVPAQSTMAFTGFIGLRGDSPGTYDSSEQCGGVSVCVELPTPADLDCSGTDPAHCPTDCLPEPTGLGSEVCEPAAIESCYAAGPADMSCVAQEALTEAMGSFTLDLTSFAAPDANQRSAIHGSLAATLVGQAGDTATLSLTF